MAQPKNHDASMDPGNEQGGIQQTGMKKRYASPALVEYGSVAKLTQGGGLSGTDLMMMMAMP